MERDDVRPAFWAAFWAASRSLSQARDRMLERHGVAPGQQAILARLWRSDHQSPGDLARSLDTTTSSVSSTAARMEAAGLITRETGEHRVTLALTGRGRALEKILDREMRTLGERALASFDDAQRAQLVRLLRELRTNTAGT